MLHNLERAAEHDDMTEDLAELLSTQRVEVEYRVERGVSVRNEWAGATFRNISEVCFGKIALRRRGGRGSCFVSDQPRIAGESSLWPSLRQFRDTG
jgi:hypothetical protein